MSGPVGDGLDGAGFPIRPAKHLWEVEHDYYCTERNYFANDERDLGDSHKSWQDFVAEWGESDSIDLDYNLLFRWDWVATGDLSPEESAAYEPPDENYRGYTLSLFWMLQRKGLYKCTQIEVCRADEPAVERGQSPGRP